MLRGIHPLLGPELLHALRTMGHGDEIVIADANFPASTLGCPVIRADGVKAEPLVEAILTHMPLDTFAPASAFRMAMVETPEEVPPICASFQTIIDRLAGPFVVAPLERFAFYERSRKAAYVVATGELQLYANLILKKGVVTPSEFEPGW
ncbi:RbsD/FucU family protein [Pseudaminobacter soli (ex Li et al. 2025)]|uniref:Ribose ABC transporter n=1 Tax=Pseudaminobacter soli (ex Li et al. 2025) TaxID=1295366 RepID=A0A2P7SIQ4_9HYPH|nr:RbsD/FucU domain-containing protein [Mesorhizobium soli]PSJ62379.1 ribose ABC transporter [Mesorhizobium soli]